MAFREMRGQEQAIRRLRRSVAAKRVSHAYLFYGPEGVGKELAAKNFAKLLNCASPRDGDSCDFCRGCLTIEKGVHPDFAWIRPLGKTRIISIKQIRDFQRTVSLKSHDGGWKVGILVDAHSLNKDAGNALLKTLEEPPEKTVIILVTSRPDMLLPTIISRCQTVRFTPMEEDALQGILAAEYSLPEKDAVELSRLCGGRFGEAVRALRDGRADEAREISRLLSSEVRRYWTPVAGILDLMSNSLARLEESVKWQLAERGLLSAGEGPKSDEALKAVDAFVFGEMRKRQEEFLEEILRWYRDVLVWKSTGREELLIGSGRPEEFGRFARGATFEHLLGAVRLIESALGQLRRNANFQTVMENLLVQITAI